MISGSSWREDVRGNEVYFLGYVIVLNSSEFSVVLLF